MSVLFRSWDQLICFCFGRDALFLQDVLRLVDMFLFWQGCSFPPTCIYPCLWILFWVVFRVHLDVTKRVDSEFSILLIPNYIHFISGWNTWYGTMDKDFGQTRNPILSNKNLICYCFGRDALPPKSRFRYSCLAKCHSRYSSVISNFPSIPS